MLKHLYSKKKKYIYLPSNNKNIHKYMYDINSIKYHMQSYLETTPSQKTVASVMYKVNYLYFILNVNM